MPQNYPSSHAQTWGHFILFSLTLLNKNSIFIIKIWFLTFLLGRWRSNNDYLFLNLKELSIGKIWFMSNNDDYQDSFWFWIHYLFWFWFEQLRWSKNQSRKEDRFWVWSLVIVVWQWSWIHYLGSGFKKGMKNMKDLDEEDDCHVLPSINHFIYFF